MLRQFVQTPVGRPLFKAVQPALHLARRSAHPGLPPEEQITPVRLGERTFAFRHRRWRKEDELAIQQCFLEAQYDLPAGPHADAIQRFYEAILASGRKPLIIDCGANIGASVVWFAARYPEAHIVAVEPATENFHLLRHNTAALDVDLRLAGISGTDGEAFLVNRYGGGMGFCVTEEPGGTRIDLLSVETLVASKPADQFTPFLLKVDIEGGEKALFSADTSSIDRFPVVLIEPHDWMCPGDLASLEFFRFHAATGREFLMKNENVASIAYDRLLASARAAPPAETAPPGRQDGQPVSRTLMGV